MDVVLVLSLTAEVVLTAERTFRNIADLPEPAENLVGIASAASVGAITAAQLQARPNAAGRSGGGGSGPRHQSAQRGGEGQPVLSVREL